MTPTRDALGIGVVSSLGGPRFRKLVGAKLVGVGVVVTGSGASVRGRQGPFSGFTLSHLFLVPKVIPGYAPWEDPASFHSAGSLV